MVVMALLTLGLKSRDAEMATARAHQAALRETGSEA